ncbi:urate oxidase uaZ [Acrasis kona]|uniref:Uricase n=1 Tax=Acrasis kona TaxID=1008807 RepID=A0AAW2ZH76_9EUKA
MKTKVSYQKYGKGCVRVIKLLKDGDRQDVREIEVQALLEGDFDVSYYVGDNAPIVATDSIKNTVYVLSKSHDLKVIEDFALVLCRHFLKTYNHVSGVIVNIKEKPWTRLSIAGQEHNHAFQDVSPHIRKTEVRAKRDGSLSITSGLDKLTLLKTTQSGFTNFVRDKYTTLPETKDRMMKSTIKAEWEFSKQKLGDLEKASKLNYNHIFDSSLQSLIQVFAGDPVKGTYSPSVQQTLYDMATDVLNQQDSVELVRITMPNRHNIVFDMTRLGLENKNEIFFPSDEPFGLIEAEVVRGEPPKTKEGNGARINQFSKL